jgi:hypothetical protein
VQVLPLEVEQALVGRLAEPEAKRHRPPLEEIVHTPHHRQLGLLDHVGRIHPGRQPGVEPDFEELPQLAPVPREQFLQGLPVACSIWASRRTLTAESGCTSGMSTPLLYPPFERPCDCSCKNSMK